MSKYFGYIRVSTSKQGEKGVSLQEQQEAITRYAQRNGLEITEWFEEQQTAAKRGRPTFARMLSLLQKGQADGVVIHKIDRSARNLKDWADLGELIDHGIDVHFVNESLDLTSRGGRLSADIQAVVAADYIRNLREETLKGFYGRLKQGLYPLGAPLGYLDRGKGNPKEIDPVKGPLVLKAFELYATGRYSLESLLAELTQMGLRNKRGNLLCRNSLSVVLNNYFYTGLMHIRKTGETFPGLHEPLITKSLFYRVQDMLAGKGRNKGLKHRFLFRRLLKCSRCGSTMVGERQKGHVYYRCHTRDCSTKGIREETVEAALVEQLRLLRFREQEQCYLRERISQLKANAHSHREEAIQATQLRLSQVKDRLGRLTDAFLDGDIEKRLFQDRKTDLLLQLKDLEDQLSRFQNDWEPIPDRLEKFLEFAESAQQCYERGSKEEKRDLVNSLTSNRVIDGKSPILELHPPLQMVTMRHQNLSSPLQRDTSRTLDQLLHRLLCWFQGKEASDGSHASVVDDIRRVA